jgi:methylthioribose-1-phosphate isomerase
MNTEGKNLRTIWLDADEKTVKIIDQRRLPHEFVLVDLHTVDDVITAIQDMYVRGAPLIGASGAYGVYLAVLNAPHHRVEDAYLIAECDRIKAARPTAVNLSWAVDTVLDAVMQASPAEKRITAARDQAALITELEVENCKKIGQHGRPTANRGDQPAQKRPAGQYTDALQCRLAGLHRARHGHGSHLCSL